jgi:hypothetical protein
MLPPVGVQGVQNASHVDFDQPCLQTGRCEHDIFIQKQNAPYANATSLSTRRTQNPKQAYPRSLLHRTPRTIRIGIIIPIPCWQHRRICLLQRLARRNLHILIILINPLLPPPLLPLEPLIIALLILLAHTLISMLASMLGVLDEIIDDPVLQGVHDERKHEHDEGDLQRRVALGPAQGPVADPCDPGQEGEDGEDAQLHEEQAEEVDDGLFEPPCCAGRVAVVARADGFGGVGERGVLGAGVQDFEEEDEDGDADGGLVMLVE